MATLGQVLGTVVLLAGSTALAQLVFPARVLPRWCGVGLIVGLPVAIALGLYGGTILFGLLWLALGYVFWPQGGSRAALARELSFGE